MAGGRRTYRTRAIVLDRTKLGEHDLILPEETQRIVQNLPDVRLIVVPGADHGSYLDHNERMGEFLLDFYAEQN